MIDAALPCERRNDYTGNAHADTPSILAHRGNYVIPTAVLIVGDNDHTILPDRTLLHRRNKIGHVLLACNHIRIARMFVVLTDWFNEGHGRQISRSDVRKEILFV